ncbi:hypothetical protein HPB52_022869 [Rhipicephalus sanguineus]|uniref:Uncharacterized protein n=1 Tax=Rhipicephalus sanguineus TaxID=34632 RepID=A0A9D4TBY1_RHISA|nr:hypothetical protein HPB52_022869 [Rhipicephalus sanguineus]
MLPSLCPPVKPFKSAYPRAWFLQLGAFLALNGVTEQPLMHAVLLNALPSTWIPAPDHPPDEVQDVPASMNWSIERYVISQPSAEVPSRVPATRTSSPTSTVRDTLEPSESATGTLPHASKVDADIVLSATRPPIAESPTAEVEAPNQRWPEFRDAATMTDAPEDDSRPHMPRLPEADIEHADRRTSPRSPTTDGLTSTGALTDNPPESTPVGFHVIPPAEFLTWDANQQDCILNAGTLDTIASTTDHTAGTSASRAHSRHPVHDRKAHQVTVGPVWVGP